MDLLFASHYVEGTLEFSNAYLHCLLDAKQWFPPVKDQCKKKLTKLTLVSNEF